MKKRKKHFNKNIYRFIIILIIVLVLTIAVIMTTDKKPKDDGSKIVIESKIDTVPGAPAAPMIIDENSP